MKVDVASHSPQMDPLVPELVAALRDLSPGAADTTLYSTVDAAPRRGETWDAEYWGRNLRRPVLFGATVERMLADGIDTVIEVGPHPTLLGSLAQAGGTSTASPLTLGSLRRGEPERAALLGSLGALWAVGHPVDWGAIFPAGTYDRQPLPRYPWQRERHWSDAALPLSPDGPGRGRPALDDEAKRWIHEPRWERAPLPDEAPRAGHWLLAGPPEAGARGAAYPARAAGRHRRRGALRRAGGADGSARRGPRPAATWPSSSGRRRTARPSTPSGSCRRFWPRGRVARRRRRPACGGSHAGRRSWAASASPHAAEQAATWGAARVIAVEHPDWWGGLVDLDPNAPADDAGGVSRPPPRGRRRRGSGGPQGGRALRAARSCPSSPRRASAARATAGGRTPPTSSPAVWAASRGRSRRRWCAPAHGGSSCSAARPSRLAASWADLTEDTEVGRRVAAVRALERAGASVHLLQADVADEVQVRAALDAYAADGWPPIAGVIHAAAVLENRLTTDMDRAAFDRVVAPKLGGALVLDRLLPDLDLFVVFSSISAFWAPAGMASYAAANAGLDALAAARRARGEHALSIEWGPWDGVGLHEHSIAARSVEELEREGWARSRPSRARACSPRS